MVVLYYVVLSSLYVVFLFLLFKYVIYVIIYRLKL